MTEWEEVECSYCGDTGFCSFYDDYAMEIWNCDHCEKGRDMIEREIFPE